MKKISKLGSFLYYIVFIEVSGSGIIFSFLELKLPSSCVFSKRNFLSGNF